MLTPDLAAELDAFLIDLNRASGEVILPLFRIELDLYRFADAVQAAPEGEVTP